MGFKTTQQPAPKQEFAIFLNIKAVGASSGYQKGDVVKSNAEGSYSQFSLGNMLKVGTDVGRC